ncbi:siderophore-interacting protein [Paractinoplanes rishiriensis]|uniref:Siderophore-interacting protein n=1 Tax=Paractinoplanes rishiriensis TaxID=1050105 RepID=A0A919JYE1_9ACTN|nr:siderophore-interacting protein [Actinoplanes rishiriensis]GIE93236.1 siderophore-interacting protein [Actinoplanes rishiriensis]
MPNRPARPATEAVVTRVEQLTPHMVRVVVGGEALRSIEAGSCTDHYIKVLFPQPGVDDTERPTVRTYTVRRWLPEIPEMWIDFVVHGDSGIAGPWAAAAQPGDPFRFMGPGGAYAPSPTAAWHLLAGDESALPAIAAALEGMPDGALVKAFIEVSGPDEEQKLETTAEAEITWLHRGERQIGELLVDAVRGCTFPDGPVHAFVHGEATFVKDLRGYLRRDCAIPLEQLSISGYWRRGLNEEGWQSTKRDWNSQVEREQETV